jgi:Fe2+ transport system protein B
MVLEILFVVCMFIWFLTNLPVPQASQFHWAGNWLAFIAVLLLGLFLFLPALR